MSRNPDFGLVFMRLRAPSSRSAPALAAALAAAAFALAGCTKSESAAPAVPASKQVGVVTVQPQRVAIETRLPGRTTARLVAEIRPQVGGIVQKRLFTEGALVKSGEVLYLIDAASFQAAFTSAQASVAKAEATLASARTTAQRNAELVKIDAISQQLNDEAQATLKQAQADLGVARAAQETARINLGFTKITSPIAGRIGLSAVTPGALVTASQTTALATVQQLDPIHVDVTQSSTELLRLKRELASGALKRSGTDAARIKLLLEDGSAYAHEGQLTFSGVTVNTGTGAVTLRAVVPNPDGLLMPGMYVRAVLEQGFDDKALMVPQQAVTRGSTGGTTALVVGPDNKVAQRQLTVDRAIGNRWQVTAGLAAGERVIVDGLQKVKVGDTVEAVAANGTELASAGPAASTASR